MKEKTGYRYLLKNVGLLTISSFTTKILSFFLVPLYTSILTTSEYGVFDIFNATIGVLIPILTLDIRDAVLRFAIDKKSDTDSVVTIGTKYLLVSNFLVGIFLIVNYCLKLIPIIATYSLYFGLLFFVQSLSGLLVSYTRGIDKIRELSISSVLSSVVMISCNILFLVAFHLGLKGYFLASILGVLFQCVYLLHKGDVLKGIKISAYSKAEEKDMLSYSMPLIANCIAWWVNTVSDRYIVVFFCGLAETGIYSVAGKIPSILNIFQGIFSQAWALSAVKDYDPEDKNGFFANLYNAYNCMLVILCSIVILMNKIIASFIYSKDFFVAWRYVPWLTIAIVFGALNGFFCGIFVAVKASGITARCTIVGAVVNLIANILLTPVYGPMGAAVATALCYVVVWSMTLFHAKKFIKFRMNLKRDILSYILLVVLALLNITWNGCAMYIALCIGILTNVMLYYKDICFILNKVVKKNV